MPQHDLGRWLKRPWKTKLEKYPWSQGLLQSPPELSGLFSGSGKVLGGLSGVFSSAFGVVTDALIERTVALAPGVLITAQLLVGVLFGFAGVILATPLVVVIMVPIQMLYVRGYLGTEVHVLGDHAPDRGPGEAGPDNGRTEQ